MYNPYQRKLVIDMIMNTLLSVLLIINLLPVNIGARILAEESNNPDESAEVLDAAGEETNNNNDSQQIQGDNDGTSNGEGSDLEEPNTGDTTNPAEGQQEEIGNDVTNKEDQPGNTDNFDDTTPIEEKDKIATEDDLENINNKEELTKGVSVRALALGAELDGATDSNGDEESGGTKAVTGLFKVGDVVNIGTSSTVYFTDSKGNDEFGCNNGACPTGSEYENIYNDSKSRYEFYIGNNPRETVKLSHSKVSTGLNGFRINGEGTTTNRFTFELVFNPAKVTWVDGDGNTIGIDYVEYIGPNAEDFDVAPTYSGNTPTKTPTQQISYSFNGVWKDQNKTELTSDYSIKGDTTFTAQFTSSTREYTITWKDGNGNTLDTETLDYGASVSYKGQETPTKTDPTGEYTYTFNGSWKDQAGNDLTEQTTVTGNETYTAQFDSTISQYEIKWVDGNGNVLQKKLVEYGTKPVYTGTAPTEKDPTSEFVYEFAGWYPEVVDVVGEATYTAYFKYPIYYNEVQYSGIVNPNPDFYTIFDEVTLKDVSREDYDFLGWTGSNGENPEHGVVISKGSKYVRIYKANWLKIEFDAKVEGSDGIWIKGSDGSLLFKFTRINNDEDVVVDDKTVSRTYANYLAAGKKVWVDEEQLEEGKQFEAESGSLVVKLKDDYLNSLSIGEHTLTVEFKAENGKTYTGTTKFVVRIKHHGSATYVLPTTGVTNDTGNVIRTLSMFAIFALTATIKVRNKVGKDYWEEFK